MVAMRANEPTHPPKHTRMRALTFECTFITSLQLSYLLAWPSLGTAVILSAQRHAEEQLHREAAGATLSTSSTDRRAVDAQTMDAMRRAAGR